MDNWYMKAMSAQKTNPQIAELLEAYKAAATQEDKTIVRDAIVALLPEQPAQPQPQQQMPQMAQPASPEMDEKKNWVATSALKITAEVITVLSDSTEKIHTVEMVLPKPENWSLAMVRSFYRRRLLPFYFRENGIVYKAITKILTDESMIEETTEKFHYVNSPRSEWTQKDYQMFAIEKGLYSFPLPNTKSLGELRSWLDFHGTQDETTTLMPESDQN